jgi:hypothetical protein
VGQDPAQLHRRNLRHPEVRRVHRAVVTNERNVIRAVHPASHAVSVP